jgi:signal transduction histidine kinase
MNYAIASRDDHKILKGYVQIASLKINTKEAPESLLYFRKALLLNKKVKDQKLESKIYNNLSVLFSDVLSSSDSGLYYLKKDKLLLEADKNTNSNDICYNVMNQASNYRQLYQYEKAIALLHQANQMPLIEHHKQVKENINTFLYLNYKEANNRDKALYHLEIANAYHDSLNTEQQNIAVNNFDTKYKTQEKELENLRLKTNIKTNRMILYSFLGLVIILLIISILVYKNIIKKKRIAEQDKLIKIQELENVLKEQELNDIDLILESQEKERQNIANELHDNLGSMLTTLKMNFQNLKRQKEDINQQENKLYDKTDALLEEAYQKVRNIAHLKNLGVIGSEGLLVAVNKMAEKMSVLEKLKINVIPFGLNERLDNTIEVTLFRMIQELCTNIIKHSEATEVNIYLTQGVPTEINIIIEDNGKGFDPKTIVSKSGIGLQNMEKKVEQMGGTFTIDSIITKGTTIIIDLPL